MFSCAASATVPGPGYYNHPLYKIQIYILIQTLIGGFVLSVT